MGIWHLFLLILLMFELLMDIRISNQLCIPGINLTCSWYTVLFIISGFDIQIIYLEFCVHLHIIYLSIFFPFLHYSCQVLVSRIYYTHKMIWETFPPFLCNGIIGIEIAVFIYWMFFRNSLVKLCRTKDFSSKTSL